MTHTFKRGDVVRCTDDSGCYRIKNGKAYKVAAVDDTCIEVYVGDGSAIDISRVKASRFVLVAPARNVSAYTAKAVDRMFNGSMRIESIKPLETEFVDSVVPKLNPSGLPQSYPGWCRFLAAGGKLKFRSGCECKFVAYVPTAKSHCQLILINPATGNIVTRYANGKNSTEPFNDPGDILVSE